MIDLHNIPNDKQRADDYLKGRRDELIDLLAYLEEFRSVSGKDTCEHFLLTVNNHLAEINAMINGDEYEEEARADHRTDK